LRLGPALLAGQYGAGSVLITYAGIFLLTVYGQVLVNRGRALRALRWDRLPVCFSGSRTARKSPGPPKPTLQTLPMWGGRFAARCMAKMIVNTGMAGIQGRRKCRLSPGLVRRKTMALMETATNALRVPMLASSATYPMGVAISLSGPPKV